MTYVVRPISDRTTFTGRHRISPFGSTWSSTETILLRELRALGARNAVLELDLAESQIRNDGRPYARAQTATPAVRVALESREHGPLSYATDAFWTWQDNTRAIALGLESLRRFARYRINSGTEQYAGFKALPAGRAMPASHMTSDEAWSLIGSYGTGSIAEQRARGVNGETSAAYRRARAANHPDRRDGDRTLWDKVEAAAVVLGLKP